MGLRGRADQKDSDCFFVTTAINGFKHIFLDDKYYQIIINSMAYLNKRYCGQIFAYVLMPNHIHLVLYFTKGNHLSAYMRDLKKYTAYRIRKFLEQDGKIGHLEALRYERGNQKYKIWQDRFDDVVIESESILTTKIEYIHDNPVRAKLVDKPEEYQYSSAQFYASIFNDDPIVTSFR